jgi:hypothetical protein
MGVNPGLRGDKPAIPFTSESSVFVKIKRYKTVILPVVLNGYET